MAKRTDPFEDIEEMLDMLTGGFESGAGALPVDVADTGDAFVVVIDLPGYDRDDIQVTLPDETTLSVAAASASWTAPAGATSPSRSATTRS